MAKRKPTTIECDPFPVFSWDNYDWTCRDLIPGWAGYRSFQTGDRSDGTIVVTVPSNEKTRTPPTSAQVSAYKHLLRNAKKIAAAIKNRIFRDYGNLQMQYADYVKPSDMPDISDADDLKDLICFSGVQIHRAAKGGISYIGVHLDCSWDDEHGLGAMMHRNRLIDFGGADTAISEWIAEADAKR